MSQDAARKRRAGGLPATAITGHATNIPSRDRVMVQFVIPGESVPWARAGAQGKRHFTPKRQSDFMGAVKTIAAAAMRGAPPLAGPVSMDVRAVYLIPESWSKKRKAAAYWKASKPDCSNITKILEDAINSIVYVDDAQVAHLNVVKIYGPVAFVRVVVESLEGVEGA
jgi:Holliday junction resolvase RusA-like endonuclease